jgi:hypothetical protein
MAIMSSTGVNKLAMGWEFVCAGIKIVMGRAFPKRDYLLTRAFPRFFND